MLPDEFLQVMEGFQEGAGLAVGWTERFRETGGHCGF